MKTILVVEDFSNIRNSLCTALQSEGYHTLNAASALEAYDLLWHNSAEISLVLNDVDMPGTNGFDLLKTIKSDPAMKSIPIAFWTNEHRSTNPEQPFTGFAMQKPFRKEGFFRQIDQAISVKGCMVNLQA